MKKSFIIITLLTTFFILFNKKAIAQEVDNIWKIKKLEGKCICLRSWSKLIDKTYPILQQAFWSVNLLILM